MKNTRIKAMTLLAVTALALAGCNKPDNGVDNETPTQVKVAEKAEKVKEEQPGKLLTDKEIAEKAWEKLSASERLRVGAEPVVTNEVAPTNKEWKRALAQAERSGEPLRIVYFNTSDEKANGRLLVFAVGNEWMSDSSRETILLANEDEMKKLVEESDMVTEVEAKLTEQGKLAETAFSYAYVSFDKNTSADGKPDINFYPMEENYFAVHHKEQVITDTYKSDLNERVWTRGEIEERFGKVLPPIVE